MAPDLQRHTATLCGAQGEPSAAAAGQQVKEDYARSWLRYTETRAQSKLGEGRDPSGFELLWQIQLSIEPVPG